MEKAEFCKIEQAINGEDSASMHTNDSAEASLAEVKVESPPATTEEATANEYPEGSVVRNEKATTVRHIDADTEEFNPLQMKDATSNKQVGNGTIPTATVIQIPLNIVKDLLMVYLPPRKFFGIKLYHNKPEFFNEKEKEEWMERSRDDAMELKIKLETGQVDIGSIRDRIVVEPIREELSNEENNRFLEEIIERRYTISMELKLIELTQKICECLDIRQAHVGRCLKLLEQMKVLELNKLMLLRNAESVYVIRLLRYYVGDLNLWKKSVTDEMAFKVEAGKLRDLASEIYDSFMNLFGDDICGTRSCWQGFCHKVEVYKMYTKNINTEVRTIMTEESYNKLVEAKNKEAIENGNHGAN